MLFYQFFVVDNSIVIIMGNGGFELWIFWKYQNVPTSWTTSLQNSWHYPIFLICEVQFK